MKLFKSLIPGLLIFCLIFSGFAAFAEESEVCQDFPKEPVIEYDSKACALEILFPQEIAKRTVVTAMTNRYADDVTDGEGNYDSSLFHAYSDGCALKVYAAGTWTAPEYDRWHAEYIILTNAGNDYYIIGTYDIKYSEKSLTILNAELIELTAGEFESFCEAGDAADFIRDAKVTKITSKDDNTPYLSVAPKQVGLQIPEEIVTEEATEDTGAEEAEADVKTEAEHKNGSAENESGIEEGAGVEEGSEAQNTPDVNSDREE